MCYVFIPDYQVISVFKENIEDASKPFISVLLMITSYIDFLNYHYWHLKKYTIKDTFLTLNNHV